MRPPAADQLIQLPHQKFAFAGPRTAKLFDDAVH